MTQEHALKALEHYKDLLVNPKYAITKKCWRNNIQHGIDSIKEKFKRKGIAIPETISKEEEKPIKSKGKK